jgi:hypothetical protein
MKFEILNIKKGRLADVGQPAFQDSQQTTS